MLRRHAAVERIDDVARMMGQPARDAKRVELGRALVARFLGAEDEGRLLAHRLGADADVADGAQIAHEPPVGATVQPRLVAEDLAHRVVARVAPAPRHHAVGGDHDHTEDPGPVGRRRRKAQRRPALGVGRADFGPRAAISRPLDSRGIAHGPV